MPEDPVYGGFSRFWVTQRRGGKRARQAAGFAAEGDPSDLVRAGLRPSARVDTRSVPSVSKLPAAELCKAQNAQKLPGLRPRSCPGMHNLTRLISAAHTPLRIDCAGSMASSPA